MKRTVFCVVVLMLVSLDAARTGPALRSSGPTALSQFFSDVIARGDVPGIVAIVVGPDKVLYHEAFGKMDVAHDLQMLLVVRSWIGPYLQPWSRSFPS